MARHSPVYYFLRNTLTFCAAYPFIGVVRFLPFKVMRFLGTVAGTLFWYCDWRNRRVIYANLAVALPECKAEHARIGRRSLVHLCLTAIELFWFQRPAASCRKYINASAEIETEVRGLIAGNKPFLLCLPHFGSWEAAGVGYHALFNTPLTVISKTMNNPYLDNFIVRARQENGNRVVKSDEAGRGIVKSLHQKIPVAMLVDQNVFISEGGEFVPFFGLQVSASRAPSVFARKFSVPVYVAACYRTKSGYEYYLKRVECDSTGDAAITAQIAAEFETIIRRAPEQYLWFYKRFLYVPRGTDDAEAARYPFYAFSPGPYFYKNERRAERFDAAR